MNSTQEAVLNRFSYGRFDVFTKNLHHRNLSAKKAGKILKHNYGLLLIKDNGDPNPIEEKEEVPHEKMPNNEKEVGR